MNSVHPSRRPSARSAASRSPERAPPAAMRRDRRPRPVVRQLLHLGGSGEHPPPVGELALQDLAGEPAALPAGEVRILDRQLRKNGLGVFVRGRFEGRVEGGQLAQHDAHRPGVGDDVVHHHREQVLSGAQAEELRAQQRPAGEVERPVVFPRQEPQGLGLAAGRRQGGQVEDRQGRQRGRRARRQDHLHGAAGALREDGAQHLVPAGDRGQRPR
jgi:hypothetical protein